MLMSYHRDSGLVLRCSKMFDIPWLPHLFQAESAGNEQASGLGASR